MAENLVKKDALSSDSYRFQDALIIKKLKDGIIIQLENGGKVSEGFVFNDNIKNELHTKLVNPKILGTVIKVRFLYQPTTENRSPVYTQRRYYPQGEELELTISAEDDKYIYATDEENFEYKIAKATWERGPKYSKQVIGTKIKCRVYKVMWGISFFDRIEIPNPYFQSIYGWVDDNEIITKTFNDWINFPDTQIKIKLKKDYNDRNANYIFSFLTLIEEELYQTIQRFDLDNSTLIINTILYIDRQLLNSGFLLTQKEILREETKKTIEAKILRFNRWLNCLLEIKMFGVETIFDDAIKTVKSSHLDDGIIKEKIFLVVFILNHFPSEYVNDIKLEDLIRLLLELKIAFKEESPFYKIRWVLADRSKILRKKLFSSLQFQSVQNYENNPMLSHFIFLKGVEYAFCIYRKEISQALLEKSSLLYCEALFTPEIKNKIRLIETSLNFLLNQRIRKIDFSNSEAFSQGLLTFNNVIARNYELLFSIKSTEGNQLGLLIKARDYYVKARAKRSHLIQYYIQYLSTLELIQNTEINDIEECLGNIMLIQKSVIVDNPHVNLFPILNYFNQFYSILITLGDNDQNQIDTLISYIKNPCNEPKGFPCIQKFAKIVLANNLISELLENKYRFWNNIQEFLKIGQFNLPLEIIAAEDDNNELDNHPMFSEENHLIELKGSIALHIDKYFRTKEIEISDKIKKSFLKTIVGMLNSSGGEVYIGILELSKYANPEKLKFFSEINPIVVNNRIIIGIEKEIESYNNSSDDHIRHISSFLRTRVGSSVMQYITIEILSIKGKNIYKIIVKAGDKELGFYLDGTEFYVRENNETILYNNEKTMEYLLKRLKNQSKN